MDLLPLALGFSRLPIGFRLCGPCGSAYQVMSRLVLYGIPVESTHPRRTRAIKLWECPTDVIVCVTGVAAWRGTLGDIVGVGMMTRGVVVLAV